MCLVAYKQGWVGRAEARGMTGRSGCDIGFIDQFTGYMLCADKAYSAEYWAIIMILTSNQGKGNFASGRYLGA